MVRNYIKKRPEKTYTTENVKAAVNDVKNHNRSYRSAADYYGVPRSVIFNRINGRKTSLEALGAGRHNALSKEVEDQLEQLILARADFGYPMDKEELLSFVQSYCQDSNISTPFKQNKPGQDWYKNFMNRHPRLSLKKPQSLQNKRALASDPFVVADHYNKLQQIVNENLFDQMPELFFNCDESGFCTDPSKIKGIGQKNKALYQRIRGTGRENISINCCISADGSYLPPHIIFQGSAVLPRWTGGGLDFPGTTYSATPKGYMEEPVFFNWFVGQFIPHVEKVKRSLPNVEPTQKALLMFDGHKSHISARLVQSALENQIILFRLPSHLTHRLQPLDFSVFSPLKTGWNRILLTEMRKCLGVINKNKMSKKDFSIAIKDLWVKYLTPDIIVPGFVGTGSLPVDQSKFPEDDYDQVALARYKCTIKKHMTAEDTLTTSLENADTSQMTSASNVSISELPQHDNAAKRNVIDFFVNKLKTNVESSVTPTPVKERQIRLKQLQYGEVLTSGEVLERLRQEEDRRKSKVTKRKTGKEDKTQTRTKKKVLKKNISESESDTNEDLEKEMQENMRQSDSDISLNYDSDDHTLGNFLKGDVSSSQKNTIEVRREKAEREKHIATDRLSTSNISQLSGCTDSCLLKHGTLIWYQKLFLIKK